MMKKAAKSHKQQLVLFLDVELNHTSVLWTMPLGRSLVYNFVFAVCFVLFFFQNQTYGVHLRKAEPARSG